MDWLLVVSVLYYIGGPLLLLLFVAAALAWLIGLWRGENLMGWHVQDFDGEYVDVKIASTEKLEELLGQLRDAIAVPGVMPEQRDWWETDIDVIEEELEIREYDSRQEDRQEMADDDARAGL